MRTSYRVQMTAILPPDEYGMHTNQSVDDGESELASKSPDAIEPACRARRTWRPGCEGIWHAATAVVRPVLFVHNLPRTAAALAAKCQKFFLTSIPNVRGFLGNVNAYPSPASGQDHGNRLRALVVPGSGEVKAMSEAEGLDRIFLDAWFRMARGGLLEPTYQKEATRSMMMAGAMPPAAHMVMSPRRKSRRSSSSSMVPISMEPVAPIG